MFLLIPRLPKVRLIFMKGSQFFLMYGVKDLSGNSSGKEKTLQEDPNTPLLLHQPWIGAERCQAGALVEATAVSCSMYI